MMQAYLSWNKEVTANVKVCEDTLTPQPEMRRPAPATKARASHCQNAKPYQMISRSLVTCTAQINNIHVVIKPAHCALCSLTFLIFFHFWYCGIDESSRGSSCPHPILHPQQTESGFLAKHAPRDTPISCDQKWNGFIGCMSMDSYVQTCQIKVCKDCILTLGNMHSPMSQSNFISSSRQGLLWDLAVHRIK